MALLTVQQISKTGLLPTYAVASASDTFVGDEHTYIEVINSGIADTIVTVDAKQNCSQGYDHNCVVTIPAGYRRKIGIFESWLFNDSSGIITITFSVITSVTVGVFKI